MTGQGEKRSTKLKTFDDVLALIDKTGPCWLWQGHITASGYGRMRIGGGRRAFVHRYVYEHLVGPIPEGLVIHHECRVKRCVNPDHLRAVTSRENTMADPTVTSINAAKTSCPQGHPYDSVGRKGDGTFSRRCSICRAAHMRDWRRRQRGRTS